MTKPGASGGHDASDSKRDELEQRLKSLEQQARLTYDILEMAATLGDFQTSINKLQEPSDILRETTSRIQGFIPFLATAYYLVDERTHDFSQALCLPLEQQDHLAAEVDYLIDNGVFALALRENSPIHVHSRGGKQRLVLHSLSTSSRTRGMFVGLLGRTEHTVSGMVLSLLSIILKNCANALESFELYRLFRENEQRYRELAEVLPHTLFEVDPNGLFLFVNQSLEPFGLEGGIPPRQARLQDILSREDAARLEAAMLQHARNVHGFDMDIATGAHAASRRPARIRMRPMLRGTECAGWRGVLMADLEKKPET